MEPSADIEGDARRFLAAAFRVLRDERVLPTSAFHPHLEVGRDYYGGSLGNLPEYAALVDGLERDYPRRFEEPLKRSRPEFPDAYVFSLLETAVFLGRDDPTCDPTGPGPEAAVRRLRASLDRREQDLACCRMVAHLTTGTGAEVTVDGILVVPETVGFGELTRRIVAEVPTAVGAWNRQDPRPYDPPHALLVVKGAAGDDENPYAVASGLSARLERFLLLARLVTAGTVHSLHEVTGPTTLLTPVGTRTSAFDGGRLGAGLVRRTVRLTEAQTDAFEALGRLLRAAEVRSEGLVTTSFAVALANFNSSHQSTDAFSQLVDLATALEAALVGTDKDTDAITLRLRSRAAALLATDDDTPTAIFADVGHLYGLRSKIVHGGQIRAAELREIVGKVSTVPAGTAEGQIGLALGYAVDRMRDLVRRAVLARLFLAAETGAVWPLTGDSGVDALLADDATRSLWRSLWHQRLAEVGAPDAGQRPRGAVHLVSPDDR